MGKARRTIIVHAFDDKAAKDGVAYSMSGYGVRNDEIRCTKDDSRRPMKKSDHHEVVFELANRSSVDLRFPANASDAIWVGGDSTSCPETPAQNPEIKPKSVSTDGERLTVHNLNTQAARFKFSLNFVDEANPGKDYRYDPIWDNQNGGRA